MNINPYPFTDLTDYVDLQSLCLNLQEAGACASRFLTLYRKGDDLKLQWQYWALLHTTFYLLCVGGKMAFERSVELGSEAIRIHQEVHGVDTDVPVLALAWSGKCNDAARMILSQVKHEQARFLRPSNP